MPIKFTCPHCGAETDVAEEYAGQTGPCAECGKTVTVPPLVGTPGYSSPSKSSSAPIVIALIVLAAIFVLLICGGVFASYFLRWAQVGSRAVAVPSPVVVSATTVEQAQCIAALEEITFRVNDGTSPGISSYHGDGRVNVLFCDGTVRSFSHEIDSRQIEVMSTIAGEEVVSEVLD